MTLNSNPLVSIFLLPCFFNNGRCSFGKCINNSLRMAFWNSVLKTTSISDIVRIGEKERCLTKADASTTRRPETFLTRRLESSTPQEADVGDIAAVPTGLEVTLISVLTSQHTTKNLLVKGYSQRARIGQARIKCCSILKCTKGRWIESSE